MGGEVGKGGEVKLFSMLRKSQSDMEALECVKGPFLFSVRVVLQNDLQEMSTINLYKVLSTTTLSYCDNGKAKPQAFLLC